MRWRKTLPLLVSFGLLACLAYRISPADLWRAVAVLPWKALVPLTAGLVVALYFWDSLCLLTVFSTDRERLTYRQMLRLRGKSYVVGAWNQGLGQAAVAWQVSRTLNTSLRAALAGSIILSWHEALILSVAALAGSYGIDNPRIAHVRCVLRGADWDISCDATVGAVPACQGAALAGSTSLGQDTSRMERSPLTPPDRPATRLLRNRRTLCACGPLALWPGHWGGDGPGGGSAGVDGHRAPQRLGTGHARNGTLFAHSVAAARRARGDGRALVERCNRRPAFNRAGLALARPLAHARRSRLEPPATAPQVQIAPVMTRPELNMPDRLEGN